MADLDYKGLSGVRGTVSVLVTDDLDAIAGKIIAAEGLNANYYADFVLERDHDITQSANGSDTYTDLGLTTDDVIVAVLDDDPATFTKEQRQVRKLEVATIKRGADSRPDTYDVNKLPNPYNGNDSAPDDGATTLVAQRPWS